MDDFGPDIISLLDEDGVEHSFEYLDTTEMDGHEYVALSPLLSDPGESLDDDGELLILRIDSQDGEDILTAIEDEDEFDRISVIFMERLSDLFEFEDEDEDEEEEDEIGE